MNTKPTTLSKAIKVSMGVALFSFSLSAHSAFTVIQTPLLPTPLLPVITSSVLQSGVAPADIKNVKKANAVVKESKTKTSDPKFVVRKQYSRLFLESRMPRKIKSFNTFSEGVPLIAAANIIQNNGWKIILQNKSNPTVKWSKNKDWLQVLSNIAGQANIYFNVYPKTKTIVSSDLPKYRLYTLKADSTFEKELARWAKESKWTLIYNLDYDFNISSNTKFYGEFSDVVAHKVLPAYKANGALLNADVIVSNVNRTIKIKEFEAH